MFKQESEDSITLQYDINNNSHATDSKSDDSKIKYTGGNVV